MNNNLSVTMATVNIGDKVVTITGDTMDLVMEARRRIEEAELKEPVETALPDPPAPVERRSERSAASSHSACREEGRIAPE